MPRFSTIIFRDPLFTEHIWTIDAAAWRAEVVADDAADLEAAQAASEPWDGIELPF